MKVMSTVATHCAMGEDPSPLFELTCVLVRRLHYQLHRKRESQR
jgi:hypothetical protein